MNISTLELKRDPAIWLRITDAIENGELPEPVGGMLPRLRVEHVLCLTRTQSLTTFDQKGYLERIYGKCEEDETKPATKCTCVKKLGSRVVKCDYCKGKAGPTEIDKLIVDTLKEVGKPGPDVDGVIKRILGGPLRGNESALQNSPRIPGTTKRWKCENEQCENVFGPTPADNLVIGYISGSPCPCGGQIIVEYGDEQPTKRWFTTNSNHDRYAYIEVVGKVASLIYRNGDLHSSFPWQAFDEKDRRELSAAEAAALLKKE